MIGVEYWQVARRNLLKAALIAPALLAGQRLAAAGGPTQLVILDSAEPASLAFALERPGMRIDLADQEATQWHALRHAPAISGASGVTRWSDLLIVQAALEERHLRLVHQRPVDERLIAWSFA